MQYTRTENRTPLISVIVPVYKVEAYLSVCLDSILRQTWTDLDIILIDDGSPDSCGAICDGYAEHDPRVRVFHTENHGLSAARNYGIEKAMETSATFLAFVDSDDWLEADMLEKLVRAAVEEEADVVVCGEFYESLDKTTITKYKRKRYSGREAVKSNLLGHINNQVMNKLWRKDLFREIRFPDGRVYEDKATTYRVFALADTVLTIPNILYHYRHRVGSITHTPTLKNLWDKWMTAQERLDFGYKCGYLGNGATAYKALLRECAASSINLWRWYYSDTEAERGKYLPQLKEAAHFSRKNIPLFGMCGWPLRTRLASILTRRATPLYLSLANIANKIWIKVVKRESLYGA